MAKQITITLTAYTLDELEDYGARHSAVYYVASRMYESERLWIDEALADFESHVADPDGLYRHEDLPENSAYQMDFKDGYNYHGARKGEYILKSFRAFCEERWSNLFFDDEEVSDYANGFEMLFASDGTLVSEDGEPVSRFA